MRLDKYLAHAGFGTRKEVKKLVHEKRVRINNVICKKDGQHVLENDAVYVDDVLVHYEKDIYIMLNKPQGVISATEDSYHSTVFDCIDEYIGKDCFPVGRLDIDTEGLLLITNNGSLAHRLLSPKHHVDKVYEVHALKEITHEDCIKLTNGSIYLDDELIMEAKVKRIDTHKIYLTIREGKFHQVKRMLEAIGNKVVYLKRISMGPLLLDENLALGQWRHLTEEERQMLLDA